MSTFRFTLRDNDGSVIFGADKVRNWASIEPALTRNQNYRGLLRKYTGDFEFVKDIRRRIIKLIDTYGQDAKLFLTIEIGDNNKSQKSFKQLGGGELIADQSSIEVKYKPSIVNVTFEASEFEQKLFNRDDNQLEYNTHTSIDGDTIPTFDDETKKIILPDRILELNSKLIFDDSNKWVDGEFTFSIARHFVTPMIINYTSDSDDIKNVINPNTTFMELNPESYFILHCEYDNKTFDLDINIDVTYPLLTTPDNNHINCYIGIANSDFSEITFELVNTYDIGTVTCNFLLNLQRSITLDEGQSVFIEFRLGGNGNSVTLGDAIYDNNTYITAHTQSLFDQTEAQCIYPLELFERLTSIVTGSQLPFYSELFGRKERGYAEDGELSRLVVLNGLMIRGFAFDDTKFTTSIRDAFKSYNCIRNLGATIERTPEGDRFRIEKFDDLFGQNIILRLGTNYKGLTRRIDVGDLFSELQIGYKDQEYEELNGLGTFNGQFGFTSTITSIDTKKDLICKYRADDYGIELARRKQYSLFPTEDTRFDDDIFLIDAKVDDATGKLIPVLGDYFDDVTGILNPSTAYNLRISPGHMLRNWGSEIRKIMYQGGQLTYTSGPSNADLITEKDSLIITEKENIDAYDLDQSVMLPELLEIDECILTRDQWNIIESDPNGLIELENKGVYLYGYIDDIQAKIAKKTAQITLKRANR